MFNINKEIITSNWDIYTLTKTSAKVSMTEKKIIKGPILFQRRSKEKRDY